MKRFLALMVRTIKIFMILLSAMILGTSNYAEAQTLCSTCPDPSSIDCVVSPVSCQQCWDTCIENPPRHRRPIRRVRPQQPEVFDLPRAVGVNLQFPQVACGPIGYWHVNCDKWWAMSAVDAFEFTALEYDLNIMAAPLHSHPWEFQWENPRKLFRSPLLDVIMFAPDSYGYQIRKCDGTMGGVGGHNYITDWETTEMLCFGMPDYTHEQQLLQQACYDRNMPMFDGLYRYYSSQPKIIIVTSKEDDWEMWGLGCRHDQYPCAGYEGYWGIQACDEGLTRAEDWPSWVFDAATDSEGNVDCDVAACNMLRVERKNYLKNKIQAQQDSAERARANNPNAEMLALHAVEIVFFGNKDWQHLTIGCDVLKEVEVDLVSVSLYNMSDGPDHVIPWVMECTGLPAERIIIGEVGLSNTKGEKQYDRIYDWVNRAFELGVRLAFVWDLELPYSYETDWSIVDRETGEWYPGMRAVRDLNDKWREH